MNEDFKKDEQEVQEAQIVQEGHVAQEEVPEAQYATGKDFEIEIEGESDGFEQETAASSQNSSGFYYQPPQNGRRSDSHRKSGIGRLIAASVIGAVLGGIFTCAIVLGYLSLNNNTNPPFLNTNIQRVEITDKTSNPVRVIAAKSGPSVVGINVTAVTNNNFFGPQQSQGSGSGIIIRADGYIMTNNHVITDAVDQNGVVIPDSKIEVVFPNSTKSYPAKLVGRDTRTDLAVIKIEAKNLPTIEFGDSTKLQIGDQVVAIGNPGGMELQGSVTAGVVSGLNRTLSGESGDVKLIQTDASINPGNSGGALVDMNGKLIGVNSSKIAATGFEGIGFAIPSETAKSISDELILNKYVKGRANLGISVDNRYTKEFALSQKMPEGVYVAEVVIGSPAEKSGIKVTDIITKFDGVRTNTFTELNDAKKLHKPGETVKIELYRDSKYMTVNLILGEDKG